MNVLTLPWRVLRIQSICCFFHLMEYYWDKRQRAVSVHCQCGFNIRQIVTDTKCNVFGIMYLYTTTIRPTVITRSVSGDKRAIRDGLQTHRYAITDKQTHTNTRTHICLTMHSYMRTINQSICIVYKQSAGMWKFPKWKVFRVV